MITILYLIDFISRALDFSITHSRYGAVAIGLCLGVTAASRVQFGLSAGLILLPFVSLLTDFGVSAYQRNRMMSEPKVAIPSPHPRNLIVAGRFLSDDGIARPIELYGFEKIYTFYKRVPLYSLQRDEIVDWEIIQGSTTCSSRRCPSRSRESATFQQIAEDAIVLVRGDGYGNSAFGEVHTNDEYFVNGYQIRLRRDGRDELIDIAESGLVLTRKPPYCFAVLPGPCDLAIVGSANKDEIDVLGDLISASR